MLVILFVGKRTRKNYTEALDEDQGSLVPGTEVTTLQETRIIRAEYLNMKMQQTKQMGQGNVKDVY